MRILIVSKYYPPRSGVASLRPYSWAKYWTRAGHDVTVITGQIDPTATALHLPSAGCRVYEVPPSPVSDALKRLHARLTRNSGGSSPATRLVRTVDHRRERFGVFGAGPRMPDVTGDLWAVDALAAVRDERAWDLVISTAAPYAAHVIASRLKQRGQARSWIADYRDLWTDHHAAAGLPLLRGWERRFEDRLMRKADVITTVSEPLADRLRARHGQKVHVIENGADADDFLALDPAPVFERDGKVRIVYTGTVYDQQDPAPLFEALAGMMRAPHGAALADRIEVIFATRSTARVAREVRRFGVDALVRVMGLVPRSLALRMQRDADLLLFLPWSDPAADGILTGKIYEYLVSGAPMLLVGSPIVEASQRLILAEGSGIRVPGASEITAFLTDYLRGDTRPAAHAKPVLERYDRRHLAFKLLSLAPAHGL